MSNLSPVCPICKGEVIEKMVDKVVRGEHDVIILKIRAGVCQKCGEQLFDYKTSREIDLARKQLFEHRVDKLKRVGVVYSY